MTAISAEGQAKLKSPRMCFEHMTSYAPPYAFLVMTVTLGTVASLKANKSFAPLRIIPRYSWSVPGRNPGTSTKVRRGTLKQSQNRTNRAALIEELMSSVPAETFG